MLRRFLTCTSQSAITFQKIHLLPRGMHGRCVSTEVLKANEHLTEKDRQRKRRQQKRRDSGRASYRFIDRTRLQTSGGSGGKGATSMHHLGRKHKRRPDGGHGGDGGSVIIVADDKEQSLRWTTPHVTAEAGKHGSSQEKHGRNGKNTVLRVPCGVVIRRVLDYTEEWDEDTKTVRNLHNPDHPSLFDQANMGEAAPSHTDAGPAQTGSRQPYLASLDYDSDEESDDEKSDVENEEGGTNVYDNYSYEEPTIDFTPWGEREKVVVADLDKPGSYVVVARGGRGGKGSCIFKSMNGPTPPIEVLSEYATPELGETAFLELELKLIADIGLVGFPNAGKSSLLSAMSRASPHIAPYPFTTLNPLVGYIEYRDGFRVCAADIPGLIAGASEGRGKGHDFLRHLERTKALLYIVDAAGVDGRDPVEDFQILLDELAAYGDGVMIERNALVVANKMDLLNDNERNELRMRLRGVVGAAGIETTEDIIEISAGVSGEGLGTLSQAIREIVVKSESDMLRSLGTGR